MKKHNGMAAFQSKVTDELNDLREVVTRVEKKLTEISQTIPDDFTVVGFAGYVHSYSFDLDWDELKPKAENLKPVFEELEAAFQRFFVFLQSVSEQIE